MTMWKQQQQQQPFLTLRRSQRAPASFELDIEGQAVRMSWCRRAAHAAALLRRKTDHGAKTIWDTMWKFLFSLHIAKTILILFMNEPKRIHLRTKRLLLEPVWNKRHCIWKMSMPKDVNKLLVKYWYVSLTISWSTTFKTTSPIKN
jgi:hypothetical protein